MCIIVRKLIMETWDLNRIRRVIAENKPHNETDRKIIRCYNKAFFGELLANVMIDETEEHEWKIDDLAAVLIGYALGQVDDELRNKQTNTIQ